MQRRDVQFERAAAVSTVACHGESFVVGLRGEESRVVVLDAELRIADEIPVDGEVRCVASLGSVLVWGTSPSGIYTVFDLVSRGRATAEVPSVGWTDDARGAVFRAPDTVIAIRGRTVGELTTAGGFRAFEAKHDRQILHVSRSPDGARAATADSSKAIRIWDIAKGTQLRRLTGRQFGSTAFAPDGTALAWTGGWGGGVHAIGGAWGQLASFTSATLHNSPPAWRDVDHFVHGSGEVVSLVDRNGASTEIDRIEGAGWEHVACAPVGIAAADAQHPRLCVWS